MGWTRIDDEFPWHPKVRKAGPLAAGLHVMALCYANKYLTDGLIERAVLTGLIDLPRGQQVRLAEVLVAVGLWERVGDDYYIHDFLEYNPSRETVLAGRAHARVRMNNRRTSPEVREKFNDPVPTPVPVPTPFTSEPDGSSVGGGTEPPATTDRKQLTTFKNSTFTVTEELLAWAQDNLKPSLNVVELRNGTLEFSEYWMAQPNKRSLPGWERCWKNRMMRLSAAKLARAS